MREVSPSIFVVSDADEDAVISVVGVSVKVLRTTVIDGEQARDRCTVNHPLSMPGFVAWGDGNRSIRDQLAPLKWTPKNRKNFPTIVSPDGKTAISVASGDGGTGDENFTPTTKNPKGMATLDFITVNQLSLPTIGGVTPIKKTVRETTWLLLVNRRLGPGGNEFIYSELSRPGSMRDKWIVTWEPRIILPPIDYATVPKPNRGREEEEGADLDIPVTRRDDRGET